MTSFRLMWIAPATLRRMTFRCTIASLWLILALLVFDAAPRRPEGGDSNPRPRTTVFECEVTRSSLQTLSTAQRL